jgi:hypothetical protein
VIVPRGRFEPGRVVCRDFLEVFFEVPIGIGITQDVRNSKTSKNGAANDLFQFMTFLCVETYNRKAVIFCYLAAQ